MSLSFTVLASGSAGNASLLLCDDFGVLLDAGLGPRLLAARLKAVGLSWSAVHAVLLTHTHSDHWKNLTLAHLLRRQIPLYCHDGHHDSLLAYGSAFAALRDAGLVRRYEPGEEITLASDLRCRAFPLAHDGGATFGFRFELGAAALGYAADLGSWDAEVAEALADVDLLALEFNHDVELEYASGRSPYLIARVLGKYGHLSNDQAAGLLREVLRRSQPGRLRHLVQLHLSRECNHPSLAAAAAYAVLGDASRIELHTARQDVPSPPLSLTQSSRSRPPAESPVSSQPWLPGMG
jgi:phosphoribosyl 1,2-cyclic phosphodiesterase